MPYTFRCGAGHDRGVFPTKPSAKTRREMARCDCGSAARLTAYSARSPELSLLSEIPEHFNRSLNMTISSRKHLEHVQRKHGLCDYSPGGHGDTAPQREPSTSWQ